MIIVTGGAGFMGNHLIEAVNTLKYPDILAVDHLTQGDKSPKVKIPNHLERVVALSVTLFTSVTWLR